ncbi:MAG: hypothetical protein AAGA35_01410 [Patescibacteria group bacterium]
MMRKESEPFRELTMSKREVYEGLLVPALMQLGANDETNAKEVAAEVYDFYAEPFRNYHGVDHPLDMIDQWFKYKKATETGSVNLKSRNQDEDPVLIAMIFFHDVIYRIGREPGFSEKASAAWAGEKLSDLGISQDHIDWIKAGILATIDHRVPESTNVPHIRTIGLLLDLDLWILAESWDTFQAADEQLWPEFQPIVLREEFLAGRAQWAASFAEGRISIFNTDYFKQRVSVALMNLTQRAGMI